MPFSFAIIGLVFLIAGVRGTSGQLLDLLQGDLTGKNNFIYWILSILIVGSLGYIKEFQGLSRAFLILLIVVLVIHEDNQNGTGGFFTKFQETIAQVTKS